jgi:hypothetical protein
VPAGCARYLVRMRALLLSIVLTACGGAAHTSSVRDMDPTPAMVAPMQKLAFMRGVWIGTARGTTPDGKPYEVTQTERMGPMLGGDVIVIEGRGYDADGRTAFNAFAVVSFDVHSATYELRSYAQGESGTFDFRPTDDGYVWEIPAGADAILRFTATVTGDHWREVGAYIAGGAAPVQTFEMNLHRVGDTDWPRGTPVARDAR